MLDSALLVAGLMTSGTGLIFWVYDRASLASRALSTSLALVGLRALLGGFEGLLPAGWYGVSQVLGTTMEALAIIAGIEWVRRVGMTGVRPMHMALRVLFRISQGLVLLYWLMDLVFLAFAPGSVDAAAQNAVVQVDVLKFAVLAPVLGSAMIMAVVVTLILLFTRVDPLERVRLRTGIFAALALLPALVLNPVLVPMVIAVGLLIFLSGSIHYLVVQGQRGQFMSQFLSPQVAQMVRLKGMERTLQRERRVLTVVYCDLRGFTAFARVRDSGEVVRVLEDYYRIVGEIAAHHGGTIKDHAGDGVLILVGAPLEVPGHARRAVLMATELMPRLQAALSEIAPGLGIGIGIATGNTTVGAIQGAGRLEYVAIGNPLNLAARLSDRAEDGEILMDTRTGDTLQESDGLRTCACAPEPLKGFPEPIPVVSLRPAASIEPMVGRQGPG